MNWVYLTIATLVATRKQSTGIGSIHVGISYVWGHITGSFRKKKNTMRYITKNEVFIGSLNWLKPHTSTEKALLWANLTGTNFMETDVGQHGCCIWTSRCHAISSIIYASPMSSNVLSIFVHFAYAYHVTVVTQFANERRYRFQQFHIDI